MVAIFEGIGLKGSFWDPKSDEWSLADKMSQDRDTSTAAHRFIQDPSYADLFPLGGKVILRIENHARDNLEPCYQP